MPEKINRLDPFFEYTDKCREEEEVVTLWEKFFPFWPMLLLILTVCAGITWFYLQIKTPLYEAKATILIRDERKGVDDSKMAEGLNKFSVSKIVENEIEVISSHAIINEVVNQLYLYAPIYQEGKWAPQPVYSACPVIIEADKPNLIRGIKKIPFKFSGSDSTIRIENKIYPVGEWVNTKFGRLRFLPNHRFSAQIADRTNFYFSLVNPKMPAKNIESRLSATSANKLASVIDLSLKDELPERSEDILNSIINEYSRIAIKDRNLLADSTLAFVEERLDKVTAELDSIEKRLEAYRSEKNAIDMSAQGKLFLDNLSINDQKVSEVDMQLAVLDQVESYVASKKPQAEIIPSSLLVSDPLLNQRLEKLYLTEMEYDKLKKTTAENNPILVSIENQINRLKPGILESIRNQKLSLRAGKANLNSTNDKYYQQLQAIPKKERDLIEISRQQAVKTSLYNFLSQKREEARLAQVSISTDNSIVDKAEASLDPVSPKKMIYYFVSVLLSLTIFIGLVTASEAFHSAILYRKEIEKHTSTPILAEIPFQKKGNPIVIGNGKTSFIAEQFRKLRSSLGYLGITGKRKKILITSVIPGEGKSFVAVNLAMSIALADKKVLLMEFDLVNPSLADKLGIIPEKGISEYLADALEPGKIIMKTPVCDNLYVICAGIDLPVNPSELILHSRTNDLIEFASAAFDYIIIDTPPVGLRSDAFTLSKFCDATLYIMRHRKTPRKSVRHIDESNKVNELKNMAIVFNGVKPKGFSKNNYGYGYNYKYREPKKRKRAKPRNTAMS